MRTAMRLAALPLLSVALPSTTAAQATNATVKGYVLDSACAFTRNLHKPISRECAIACGKTVRARRLARHRDREHRGSARE